VRQDADSPRMHLTDLNEILLLLRNIQKDPVNRKDLIFRFQNIALNAPDNLPNEAAWEILSDLEIDIDYYEQDPVARAEDPSFFGEDRLEVLLEEVFDRLKSVGVE
jgi:hypothetical protein